MINRSVAVRIVILMLLSFVNKAYAQPPYSFSGPVAVFTYDNAGNRVKREIKNICVGIGCPPEEAGGPVGKPANPNGVKNLQDAPAGNLAIDAYPNPTENELYISNSTWHNKDAALVVVYDINSKVVIKKEITQAKDKISFEKMMPGTYMVQYYLNNVPAQLWKIIKP